MIADYENDRILIETVFLEISDEVRQRGIRVSDLAIVKVPFISLRIRRRRLVRIVRIVEVHPQEVRARWMPSQPRLRTLGDVDASALDSSPARLGLRMLGKIIVEIKASIEAGSECFAVEDHRANECCGVIGL